MCSFNTSRGDAVYDDFSRSFDKIDHGLLIRKLAGVILQDGLRGWFDSYIRDRQQSMVIGGCSSPFKNKSSGVPQVLTWGLYFSYPISTTLQDVLSSLNPYVHLCSLMYADDLKIFCSISSPTDSKMLQDDLNISIILHK